MAGVLGDRALEGVPEQSQLALAADDRRVEPARMRESAWEDGEEAMDDNVLFLSLHRQRTERLGADRIPRQPVGGVPDQDLPACGRRLQALRDVHGVACGERLPGGGISGDHLAAVDPDAHADANSEYALELDVQALDR